MKRFLNIFFVLAFCNTLYGLPTGNPAEMMFLTKGVSEDFDCCDCSWWNIRFGYYGDFVFNRNLQINEGGFKKGEVIRKFQINTNAGSLVFNLANYLDLFGTFGTSKIFLETSEASFTVSSQSDGFLSMDTQFSWSAGARLIIYEWNCFYLGAEAQYFETRPHFSHYISALSGFYNHFDHERRAAYRDWQIGAVLSYAMETICPDASLIPYIGGKWSRAQFDTKNFKFIKTGTETQLTIFDLKSHKSWGFSVGTTFILQNKVGITVEGQFGEERALFVNGEFAF